jgi:hypothetical protein
VVSSISLMKISGIGWLPYGGVAWVVRAV